MSELHRYKLSSGKNVSVVKSSRRGRPDRIDAEIMRENIRAGISRGWSDNEVALYADCSQKTVFRYRKEHSIPPNYLSARRFS
jgi:hypothetical protein